MNMVYAVQPHGSLVESVEFLTQDDNGPFTMRVELRRRLPWFSRRWLLVGYRDIDGKLWPYRVNFDFYDRTNAYEAFAVWKARESR